MRRRVKSSHIERQEEPSNKELTALAWGEELERFQIPSNRALDQLRECVFGFTQIEEYLRR